MKKQKNKTEKEFLIISKEMLDFVSSNPTAFHTAGAVARALNKEGFTELFENKSWKLETGKGYYVLRNGSSIIALKIPKDTKGYRFRIAASHTDSPAFRLKELSDLSVRDSYIKLNTEGYGGMLCATWMDRPLSIAGRVLVKSEGVIKPVIINIDRDTLVIPSVAIHMNRDANSNASYNKQVDMLPLFCGKDKTGLKAFIAGEIHVDEKDIIGSDLFLYVRSKPSIWGANKEFVSAPRLDDQQCVFAGLKGFLEGAPKDGVNILASFDNEEVGSGTKQGAASTFLSDVLKRINMALGRSKEDYICALSESFMLSTDNAHGMHPNHPELTDDNNNVFLNEGVVVKSHAGQKYTSDGMSIAFVRELAQRAGIPLQYFSNRSDKEGGSTLGNIAVARVSINCADIGLPQLAMHSAWETAGVKDTLYMKELLKEFYSGRVNISGGMIKTKYTPGV